MYMYFIDTLFRPHKVNFLFLVLQSHLKMTRPPGSFFPSFFRNQGGKKVVYKQQNTLWRVRSGDKTANADNCVSKESKYRSLDGEAIECRLCKRGCMLNTDYI